MILFDTSVLSRVFRRKNPGPGEEKFRQTVENLMSGDEPLGLPGMVLQEILTGISSSTQFEDLQARLLASFRVVHATTTDHIEAARLRNRCLRKGVNVSGTDCLIAITAMNGDHELFAVDSDFDSIAKIAPLKLFRASQK